MSNVIEILLSGRNAAGPALAAAGTQVRALSGELATLSPGMAATAARAESLAGVFGGVGAGFATVAGVGAIMGAMLVGIGAAGFEAGKKLADVVEDLDRLASRTGVSVDNLQVLREIIRENGGNAEELSTALTFLNRAIGNQDPMLKSLGITTRDTFAAFQQLAAIISRSGDTAANTTVAMHLLGRGSGDLLGQLDSLTEGFGPMQKRMIETGALMRGDLLTGARALDSQLDALSLSWSGMATRIQGAVVPALTDALRLFNDIADAINGVKKGPEEILSRGVEKLKSDIADISSGLDKGLYQGEGAERARANLERMVAELERVRAKITEIRAESGKAPYGPMPADADTTAALRRAAEATDAKAAEARAKKILEIAEALRSTGMASAEANTEAIRYYTTLEEFGKRKFLQSLLDQLEKTKSLTQLVREAQERLTVTGPVTPGGKALEPRGAIGQLKPTGPVPYKPPTFPMETPLETYRAFLEEITSGSEIVVGVVQAIGDGLRTGLQSAFMGILTGAMNFAQALKSIFSALVSAIVSELARIAALKIVKWLVSLINPLGAFSGTGGGVTYGGNAMKPASTTVSSVTNVYNFSGIDSRSMYEQAVSPFGSIRRSNVRVNELAGAIP